MTKNEIIAQKMLYRPGDVFSFTAEPAASKIRGVNCFNAKDSCVFESASGNWNAIPEFNKFLLDGVAAARETFAQIGLPNMYINAGGLDLFVATGWDNPDWNCGGLIALYPETVKVMEGFVIDHYYDPSKSSMDAALDEVTDCYPVDQYPNLRFSIGEWGPVSGSDTPEQITQAFADLRTADSRFQGTFNYWQGGPAGQESLFTGSSGSIGITDNYLALKAEYYK